MSNKEKAIQYITTMTDQEAKKIVSFLEGYNFDTAAALAALKKEREVKPE